MSLQVIGTGQGRTGTTSLKLALEQLGFGKCYHMFELFRHPDDLVYFKKAESGAPVDWDRLFEGYISAVDYPVISYYKQLIVKYPDAKIIHTSRDAETWYKSACETIFWATKPSIGRMLQLLLRIPFNRIVRKRFPILIFGGKILERAYGKELHNKEEVIKRYNAINEDVLKTVPKERLLIYDLQSGWEPLCTFLNVPVPAIPFPRSNDKEKFLLNVRRISTGKVIEME